jgi:hypothetical protein
MVLLLVLRIVGDFLWLVLWRRAWDLLDVGRLMLRWNLRIAVLWWRIVALSGTLVGHRGVWRVGVVLLVLDYSGPRMVLVDKMVGRRQALRWVGMMLEAIRSATATTRCNSAKEERKWVGSVKREISKKRRGEGRQKKGSWGKVKVGSDGRLGWWGDEWWLHARGRVCGKSDGRVSVYRYGATR